MREKEELGVGRRRNCKPQGGSGWTVLFLLHQGKDAFLVSSAPSPFGEESLSKETLQNVKWICIYLVGTILRRGKGKNARKGMMS